MAAGKLVIAGIAGAVAAAAVPSPARADDVDLDAVVTAIDAGDAADVIARLRPRLDQLDAAGRCALALAYAGPDRRDARPDRTRALIYLPSCGGDLPTAIAERAGAIQTRLIAKAERAGDARIEIVTGGASVPVEIDRLAGDVVIAPATLWLPAADYQFTARLRDGSGLVSLLSVARGKSGTVLFELPAERPVSTAPSKADFTDGEPEATYVGAPPKEKHPSLIGGKFGRGLEANRAARETMDIPVAVPRSINRRTLGVRVGAAIVDSATGSRVATTAAVILRQPLAGRFALDARFDVSRRGPSPMTDGDPDGGDTPGVWVGGLGGFARWWLTMGETTGVSVVAGVRAEVRHVFDGATELGASLGAGVAVDLFGQFELELRGEQGVNELAGSRPRAIVFDLGMDL